MTTDQLTRFLAKVSTDVSGCWIWTAARQPNGYSVFGVSSGKTVRGHRASYEHFIGPIPEGMEIDHVCVNRACVNPTHLQAITHTENIRRGDYTAHREYMRTFMKGPKRPEHAAKLRANLDRNHAAMRARTACHKGHLFDEQNTRVVKRRQSTIRVCLACQREHVRRHREKQKAA